MLASDNRKTWRSTRAELGGVGIVAAVKCMMSSLDYKVAHYDVSTDPARPEFQGRFIFVFWHEYITFPLTLWGRCDVTALVSLHRDAEMITCAARHWGFPIIRGSTSRGAVAAVRKLTKASAKANLALMPDGPKGPRRKLAVGPIYLSSRLGIPLVPVGFGYDRPIRMPTWDRFAIPRPFSRARSIFGPPMHIPRKLGRAGLERYRQQAETLLLRLSDAAEDWARTGTRMRRQLPICRLRKTRGVALIDSSSPKTRQSVLPLDHSHEDPNRSSASRRQAS